MTNQQMINNIKDNLGNRSSGRIGSRTTDAVVLDALNLAVPHTVLEAQPDYYNRETSINVVAGTRTYELPTVDTEGDTIRIKDIYAHRMFRLSGTEVIVRQLNYADFVKRTADYDLNFEGTPSYFSLWGKNNTLTFDFVPTEIFTLRLYVEVYPNLITSGNLSSALPIDDQWNIVVEAYATKHCYLKMQQTEMYQFWQELYDREKAAVSRQENKLDSKNISASSKKPHVNDPLLNPFVRNWN
jgi:hypothetical protein